MGFWFYYLLFMAFCYIVPDDKKSPVLIVVLVILLVAAFTNHNFQWAEKAAQKKGYVNVTRIDHFLWSEVRGATKSYYQDEATTKVSQSLYGHKVATSNDKKKEPQTGKGTKIIQEQVQKGRRPKPDPIISGSIISTPPHLFSPVMPILVPESRKIGVFVFGITW